MKRFAMAITLSGLLSASTLAGEVPTVGINSPPPNEPPAQTVRGDISTSGLTQQISEAALTLIQLMLGTVV